MAVATTQDWIARCAAAQHSNPPQPFPEAALFRAMAAHDTWLARADFSVVYADSESASNDGGDLKKFSGLELLAALPASLAHTVVRSSSTAAASLDERRAGGPALELTALKLAHLRTFLQVSVVEGILRRLVAGADPPQFWQARLREFNEYFVLAKAPPGGSAELNQTTLHWARVPDSAGRRIVAAFTAQDALQNFVAAGNVGDGLVSVRIDGRMFWAHVNSNASLHGVVFNPAGPGEPIPLAREIAQAVLGA
jgi:hypothetical protein